MSDTEELSQEDQYEKDLLDAGKLEAKAAEEVADDAPEPVADIATPEKPEVEETAAEVAEAEEFFPGYKDLSDEAKAFVRAKMEAAEKVAEFQQIAGKAEADRRATVNKLAPLQREYQALLAKQKEAAVKQTDSTKGAAKAALEKFQRDYPDEAEALLAVNSQFETFAERAERENAELRERLDELAGNFQAQQVAVQRARERDAEYSALQQEHPDFREIDADPRFKAWLQACGDPVINLLNEGKASSTSFVLSNYKRDLQLADQLSGQPATPNTPASRPLARTVADPNPTARRTTAIPRSNSSAGLDGEEKYLAELREAGIDV